MSSLSIRAVLALFAISYPLSAALASKHGDSRIDADAIYYNGKVITMDTVAGRHHDRDDDDVDGDRGHRNTHKHDHDRHGDKHKSKAKIAQAFAVKDGRFIAVGSNGDTMQYKGRNTRLV